MTNLAAIRVKSNANYICQECGSTELIQAHHQVPGDDSSLVVLCAECHSQKHPNLPKALFFSNNHQPYWHNKSASSLADELFIKLFLRRNGNKKHNPKNKKSKHTKLTNIQFRDSYSYFCPVCSLCWVSSEIKSCCPLGHTLYCKI